MTRDAIDPPELGRSHHQGGLSPVESMETGGVGDLNARIEHGKSTRTQAFVVEGWGMNYCQPVESGRELLRKSA